jgi:hypothetical protein
MFKNIFNMQNIASLAVFTAGLVFFMLSKRRSNGIDSKSFISGMYMLSNIPIGNGVYRKLLLRRLQIADIVAIGGIPNWIQIIMLSSDIKTGVESATKTMASKKPEEQVKETIEYYAFLQKVAERCIVKWDEFVSEWKAVDSEFTGKLPDITLQYIFNLQLNQSRDVIKKKTSYKELLSLQKNSGKNLQATSKMMDGKVQA